MNVGNTRVAERLRRLQVPQRVQVFRDRFAGYDDASDPRTQRRSDGPWRQSG